MMHYIPQLSMYVNYVLLWWLPGAEEATENIEAHFPKLKQFLLQKLHSYGDALNIRKRGHDFSNSLFPSPT